MPVDQKRLAQFLGMLGSDHDGEVVNAAKMAHRMVTQAGLTWEQVLHGGGYTTEFVQKVAAEAYAAGKVDGQPRSPRKTFAGYSRLILRKHFEGLNEWEIGFLDSWTTKTYPPSEKQLAVFVKIAEKTGVPIPPEAWNDVA